MTVPARECAVCASADSGRAGSRCVALSEHWALTVFPGYDLPGWYFLQSREHVSSLADLASDALSEFGHCLSSAVEAVRASAPCDKVYLYRFGEAHEHWHVLLCAKPAQVGESAKGAALVVDREQYRDDATAARVGADVERMLQGWPALVGASAESGG